MNKQKKILLLLSAIVVILAAGTAVLLLKEKEEMPPDRDGDPGILYETDRSQIASVTIHNSSGSFSVLQKEDGIHLEHFPDVPLDQEGLEALFHYASLVRSLEQLSGDNNKEEYGLAHPQAAVTVSLKDNSSYALSFGDVVPGQDTAETRYLLSNDQIYTTYSLYAQPFFRSEESYIDHRITPLSRSLSDAAATSDTILTVTDLSLHKDPGEDFSVSLSGTEQVMSYALQKYELRAGNRIYPFTADALGTDFLFSVFNLISDSVVCVHPSDEDLASFGLQDPAMIAEVSWQSASALTGSFALSISPQADGGAYLMRRDTDIIYHLANVPLFCTAEWPSLVSTYLLMPKLTDLVSVTIETPEKQYRFCPDFENQTVQIDDHTIPLSSFQDFYTRLIQMKADSLVYPTQETADLFSAGCIRYEYASGETESIFLYALSPRKLLVCVGNDQYEMSSVMWNTLLNDKIYGSTL